MDAIKGFRTVLFNVLAAAAVLITLTTGVETKGDLVVLQQGVEQVIEGIVIVWVVGSVWLRAVTDSPIFKSKK
jgi:hypothetical protein